MSTSLSAQSAGLSPNLLIASTSLIYGIVPINLHSFDELHHQHPLTTILIVIAGDVHAFVIFEQETGTLAVLSFLQEIKLLVQRALESLENFLQLQLIRTSQFNKVITYLRKESNHHEIISYDGTFYTCIVFAVTGIVVLQPLVPR
jgi:hypothetical protein